MTFELDRHSLIIAPILPDNETILATLPKSKGTIENDPCGRILYHNKKDKPRNSPILGIIWNLIKG